MARDYQYLSIQRSLKGEADLQFHLLATSKIRIQIETQISMSRDQTLGEGQDYLPQMPAGKLEFRRDNWQVQDYENSDGQRTSNRQQKNKEKQQLREHCRQPSDCSKDELLVMKTGTEQVQPGAVRRIQVLNNRKESKKLSEIEEINLNSEEYQIEKQKQQDQPLQQQTDSGYRSRLHSLREKIGLIITSEIYRHIYMLFLTIFAVSLVIYNFEPNSSISNPGYNSNAVIASFYMELTCQCFFVFNLLVTLINYPQIELNWFLLDLFSTVVGIVALFLPAESFDLTAGTTINARNFLKAFRALKLLLFIRFSSTVNLPANNLLNSLKSVGKIMVPALCFIYMYAVVGLYSFSDHQYNRCRPTSVLNSTANWTVYESQTFLCGARSCPESYSCLNPVDYGVSPSSAQLRKIQLGNGLMTYQNIFHALLSTFKQIFGTGCSRLIILQKQAANFIYVEAYYLSFIYLLSYIYLNIFYGLMMSNQEGNADQNPQKAAIISNHNLDTDQFRKTMMKATTSGFKSHNSNKVKAARKSLFRPVKADEGSKNKNVFETASMQEESYNKSHNVLQDDPFQNNNSIKSPPNKDQDASRGEKTIQLQRAIQFQSITKQNSYGIINMCILNQKENEIPDINFDRVIPLRSLNNNGENSQKQQSQEPSNQLESEKSEQEITSFINWNKIHSIYVYLNHMVIVVGFVNLTLDFEGQSSQFEFIVDVIDFGAYVLFFTFCVIEILTHLYRVRHFTAICVEKVQIKQMSSQEEDSAHSLQLDRMREEDSPQDNNDEENRDKFRPEEVPLIPKVLLLQLLLLVLCTSGIIYEGVKATSFDEFLSAQDGTAKVFRSFKYLRILVLLVSSRYFTQARIIVISIFATVYRIKNFIVFWLLMVLVCAVMGFHLFGYRTPVDHSINTLDYTAGTSFPISFDGMFNSLVFTMFTFYNEEWDYIMFQQYLGSGALMVIWQIMIMLVGLTLMSKYFMALLMKELGVQLDRVEEEDLSPQAIEQRKKRSIKLSLQVNRNQPQQDSKPTDNDNIGSVHPLENARDTSVSAQNDMGATKAVSFQKNSSKRQPRQSILDIPLGLKRDQSRRQSALTLEIDCKRLQQPNKNQQNSEQSDQQDASFGVILTNKVLRVCRVVLEHRYYKFLRVIMILMSMSDLIFRHPQVDPTSTTYTVMNVFDNIVKAFFFVELIVELLAFGLLGGKKSYLRKSWVNWGNMVVVIIEVLSYAILGQIDVLSKVQTVKVVRVLYFIEMRYDSDRDMRLTVVGFRRLVPKILTLLGVTFITYGFFALLLVKFYKNNFYYCDGVNLNTSKLTINSGTSSMDVSIQTRNECLFWGGDWIKYRLNSSHFFNSLLFCFASATMEGWTTLSVIATSLNSVNKQPFYNANSFMNIFFMIFYFFGNMIMLNVFIGLTMNNFKKIKEEVTGAAKLTKVEKQWLSIKKQIYRLTPQILDKPPNHPIRNICYLLVKSHHYTVLKTLLFLAFILSMSLFTTNMDSTYFNALIITKFSFVSLEVVFYIIELLAFGIRSDNLRQFIFQTTLLLYALIYGILLLTIDISKSDKKIFGGILIAMLLVDYFQIMMEFEFVKKMLNSLISILPRTTNLLIIILCTLYIYTIVGMELFSFLKTNNELNSYDQNYRNFQTALFSLVKFSLMESPIDQLSDAAQSQGPNFICYHLVNYEDFKNYGQMGCGNVVESYVFFLSFHVIYSLILMSTMIAIIFDAYSQVRTEEQAMVNKFQLQQVKEEWKTYDPEATGYISYRDFWMFTAKLVKIYQFDKENIMSSETKQSFLQSLQIPIYQHPSGILCFQFHEVIEALTRVVFKRKNGKETLTKKADQMFKENEASFLNHGTEQLKRSYYDSSHVLTLIILKSGLRIWRKKSKMSEADINAPVFATFKIKEKIDQQRQQENKLKETARKEQARRVKRRHARKLGLESFHDQQVKQEQEKQEQENWAGKIQESQDNKCAALDSKGEFIDKKNDE